MEGIRARRRLGHDINSPHTFKRKRTALILQTIGAEVEAGKERYQRALNVVEARRREVNIALDKAEEVHEEVDQKRRRLQRTESILESYGLI